MALMVKPEKKLVYSPDYGPKSYNFDLVEYQEDGESYQ